MFKPRSNKDCPSVKEILALLKNPSKDDIMLIEKAYLFAKEAHMGQIRNGGEPYFDHVANVAKNLAFIHADATTITAGLLHDTIEDLRATPKSIEAEFGKEVLVLVEGVTKLSKLEYSGAKRHAESLRKFIIALSRDIRVLLIKLADRLHNIQTLDSMPKEKQRRMAMETIEIHARLADRFGMSKWKSLLEDSAFPYAYPKEYEEVHNIVKNERISDEKYIKKTYQAIQKKLAENGIKNVHVDYRIKNLYGLWKKLEKRDMDPSKVFDILAVRVVVPSIADCYHALGVIHKHWKPVPGRIKDFIAVPKPNGYKSLHTTIFRGDGRVIEIQIRTSEMHNEAQYGIASHLVYKEKDETTKDLDMNLAWVKELAKWQKDVAESEEFMEHLRMDFFKNRVFVYTPKGDVIDLPEDSCPIDFAYAIHSNIGDHVSSAKINGKLVSIDTKLKNGDIVEIETKESAAPKRKWLDYTKTSLAKKHIRTALEKSNPIELLAQKFFGKKK